MATGAAAARLGDSWAGGAADSEQAADLVAVRNAASRAATGEFGPLQAEGAHVERWLNDPTVGRPGGAMYRVALCHIRWAPLQQWLDTCTLRKRWLRPGGQAFRLAKQAGHYTAANHIVRLLAGGHWPGGCKPGRGPAGKDPALCAGAALSRLCGAPPPSAHDGLAWCRACSSPP